MFESDSRATGIAFLSLAGLITVQATATATSNAALPTCQHFYPGTIPDRPVSGGHGPGTEAGAYSVSSRLPAPGGVTGGLSSDGKVMFAFSRVPGAVAYRTSATARPCNGSATGGRRVSWSPTPARARTPTTRFTR